MKCDICGADMSEIIEVKRESDGKIVTRKNIGLIRNNGEKIVKICYFCHHKIRKREKKWGRPPKGWVSL